MDEAYRVGDVFPVKSPEKLRDEGIEYWKQRISTPMGIFLYDSVNEKRDGKSRWVSEDGKTRITTFNFNDQIEKIVRS